MFFDTLEQVRCRFYVWVLVSPVFGEVAGAGGGEDGLAEDFEDLGDFFEAAADFVDFCEKFFDFGDDSFLLGKRRNLQC